MLVIQLGAGAEIVVPRLAIQFINLQFRSIVVLVGLPTFFPQGAVDLFQIDPTQFTQLI